MDFIVVYTGFGIAQNPIKGLKFYCILYFFRIQEQLAVFYTQNKFKEILSLASTFNLLDNKTLCEIPQDKEGTCKNPIVKDTIVSSEGEILLCLRKVYQIKGKSQFLSRNKFQFLNRIHVNSINIDFYHNAGLE